MAFDGLVTKAITRELENTLIGGKIDKIYEPDKYTVLLGIYNNGNNFLLNISCSPENSRLHLTWHNRTNPKSAPNFCMLLRKHLSGAKLLNIVNNDLERIIEFEFECYNEYSDKVNKRLIIEIMGRYSNIILVNNEYKVIDSLKHFSSSRSLLPGKEYIYPKSDKVSIYEVNTFEEFSKVLESYGKNIQDTFTGFSKSFVTYIKAISNDNLQDVYSYISSILNDLNSPDFPLGIELKLINDNKDYCIVLKEMNDSSLPYLSINTFIDNFYYEKETKDVFVSTKNNLLKIILASLQKYSKRLENINRKLKDAEERDLYKLYGELIISNLYKFNGNIDTITLENYYDNNKPITIPLDKTISPHKNADRYFKKYNKLKNTIAIVTKQKYETEKELEYLETLIYAIDNSITIEELQEVSEEMRRKLYTWN